MNTISFVIGLFVGMIITVFTLVRFNVGTLRIDHSDPSDPPYLFAELKIGIPELRKKKLVLMEVVAKNYVSQE